MRPGLNPRRFGTAATCSALMSDLPAGDGARVKTEGREVQGSGPGRSAPFFCVGPGYPPRDNPMTRDPVANASRGSGFCARATTSKRLGKVAEEAHAARDAPRAVAPNGRAVGRALAAGLNIYHFFSGFSVVTLGPPRWSRRNESLSPDILRSEKARGTIPPLRFRRILMTRRAVGRGARPPGPARPPDQPSGSRASTIWFPVAINLRLTGLSVDLEG